MQLLLGLNVLVPAALLVHAHATRAERRPGDHGAELLYGVWLASAVAAVLYLL